MWGNQITLLVHDKDDPSHSYEEKYSTTTNHLLSSLDGHENQGLRADLPIGPLLL